MHMPTRFASRLRTLALALVLALPGMTCGSAPHSASAQSTEANITRLTANILARSQFAHHPLDKELAGRFLDRYLDSLDGNRSLILQSDVQSFSASAPSLIASSGSPKTSRTLSSGVNAPTCTIKADVPEYGAQQCMAAPMYMVTESGCAGMIADSAAGRLRRPSSIVLG